MIQRDFTAELHCQYGQIVVTSVPSSEDDGIQHALRKNWLVVDQGNDPAWFRRLTFHFKYLKTDGARHHYQIEIAEPSSIKRQRLEKSTNNWLKFYDHLALGNTAHLSFLNLTARRQYWKIQVLGEWDGDMASAQQVEFYLRDAAVYRVANTYSALYDYFGLHAGPDDGDILKFHLRNITLV
ncbi:hypothetical protein [Pseudomonas muyukensis]|uniref:Transposase n=1 Tax=Pseudomonas muyukensis TaxID=2842357 RepID=A0ABX8M5T0_9PSED|nr:hypothetical protein [Pseudomonas muyukensis]QXH34447.1 hypothetical protein KSS95_20180 [Pseudomonas muyukensis]